MKNQYSSRSQQNRSIGNTPTGIHTQTIISPGLIVMLPYVWTSDWLLSSKGNCIFGESSVPIIDVINNRSALKGLSHAIEMG